MSRKSFRATRPGGAGDWVTEMMHAIVSDSALEELGVSVEEAGKAVCKNIFPVVKKHIAFIVESNNPNFEAALVDEITQGEGPISSLELLEKVKEATQRIKELTDIVDSQSEKMRELETNLAQANEFLEKVENVKEDALSAAEKSKEFAKKEEEKFPKTNKEFLDQLRSEVRDEVALELAEQMTAATAASSVETAEKEIQTDPISLGPPEQTQEAVPVAPPPPTAPAVPHETSAAHQELTDADHELLRTCLEEIRNLTSLLSNHAGIPTVVQHKDVVENRRRVSMRNTCVGTSEGVLGGQQGNVYEHVPLTTLHLSPIYRAHPERAELGSARSIRLSAPLSPHSRLQLERSSANNSRARGADFGAVCPPAEATLPPAASGTANRPSVVVETATLQDGPLQQTFVHSHLMSAELPEAVSLHQTQDYPTLVPCCPAEGSPSSLSPSREGSALRTRSSGAAKAHGKLQISFADEPLLASDPLPGSSCASSTIFNQGENSQQAPTSPQEQSETAKATPSHTDTTNPSPLPPEPKAAVANSTSAVLNPPQGDNPAVGTTTEPAAKPQRECPSSESVGKPDALVSGVRQQQQQQQQATEKCADPGPQEPNASPGGGVASLSPSHASFVESLVSDGTGQGTTQEGKDEMQSQQQPGRQQEQGVNQYQREQHPPEQQQDVVQQQQEEEKQQSEQEQQQDMQQEQTLSSLTRDNSFCVSPEVIFGQHGPPIWPMVTGGLSWCRCHETKSIPLARFQRQTRGEFKQIVEPVECTSTPLVMCSEAGREHFAEASQELLGEGLLEHRPPSAETSTAVYLPLKGSKLGSGARKPAKKETRPTSEATCKTLNDLRIRNQVLENQVLGLSVALRQAHERLNTLTRVCDKLSNGVPAPK